MATTANADVRRTAPVSALTGWILVDWALQPFHTLIVTFLFAPYFTTVVASDPTRGQELWGYAAAIAGLVIAFGAPVLGAHADHSGRRKPWVAVSAAVMAVAAASLWIATPGADTWTIVAVLAAFIVAMAAAEYTSVFTNSLMPTLVPPDQMGRLSGTSWAVAFTGGLVSLFVVAGLLVANPDTGKTLMGLDPLLRLDTASREGDRLVGPFAAAWLLLFILPFFLFVPDAKRGAGLPVMDGQTPTTALGTLWQTIKSLPAQPSMLLFLIARALYTDGLTAIFVFGGIYGTAVFGWGLTERGLFGIALIITGIVGATVGGFLDDRVGSKRVILGALMLLMIGSVGILSITSTHILFTVPIEPKVPGAGSFASMGEQVFLFFACLVAVAAAPNQSASRTLLARLAPPDKTAQYFGLFAFSGKATAFLAPLLIALATSISGDQRIGISMILVFLVSGFLLMLPVRERR